MPARPSGSRHTSRDPALTPDAGMDTTLEHRTAGTPEGIPAAGAARFSQPTPNRSASRRGGRGGGGGGGGGVGGAGEARGGRVLGDVLQIDQGFAGLDVLVLGGFGEGQHRGDAGIGADEDLGPLVAGLGAEAFGEQLLQGVLARGVDLIGQALGVDTEAGQQLRVELRLDGADGHVLAVGGFVGVVERHAGVEQVGPTLLRPGAGTAHTPDHVRKGKGPIDHRGIDDLPLTGGLPFHQRGQDAEHQEHRTAAEIADHVQRWHRALALAADGVQDPGEADVVDVVARAVGHRSELTPAGHPAVHQPRIAGQHLVGAEAHAFGDARAEAFDQHVGLVEQPEHLLDIGRVLEIGLHDGAAAQLRAVESAGQLTCPLHAHHVGAEIGKQQRGVRTWADAGQFDNPDARERALRGGWSAHALPRFVVESCAPVAGARHREPPRRLY